MESSDRPSVLIQYGWQHEPSAWFYSVGIPPSPRCNAHRSPSLFLRAAHFTTHGARIPGAPFNFRIAGNVTAVHQHFLCSFSFLRLGSRTFHNASRNVFDQGLQFSSPALELAVAFAVVPAPDSLRGYSLCWHWTTGLC